MAAAAGRQAPSRTNYDVVIIGGAIMGSSAAWFLTGDSGFKGSVLVVERDPRYEMCSTAHTNSCIRQQFSAPLNIRISQFTADFIHNLRENMGGDERAPELKIQNFGYLYLADTEARATALRAAAQVQQANGAGTVLLGRDDMAEKWPFYQLDDIILGSHNTKDEGYWEGHAVFDCFRRQAKERGAEYIHNEVTAMTLAPGGGRVSSVTLSSGEEISCGTVVNCAGPRASRVARMAGIDIPVEPRKRYSYVFTAERPLDRTLPLTIDPSGVHMRQDGAQSYLAGGHPDEDPAVEPDDFSMDHSFWEDHVWPLIAARIPQFEAIRVRNAWAGHYAYNTLDHNAIIGPHDRVENFIFCNGFSGHGLQQSPAMGRGVSELITHGGWRSLDLSPFGYGRIARGEPFEEHAVI